MTRKLSALAALALAIAVPVALAAPKPNQTLSITATPEVVTFGKELKVTGQLVGGTARDVSAQRVTLESDPFPYEGTFERVGTAETNDSGHYSLTLKPGMNAKYRTSAKGGVQSADITVPVRVAVTRKVSDTTPKLGARVTFSGTVTPAHDGLKAKIQRRTSDGWRTATSVTLADGGDAFSTYSKRVRIKRSGRYRVRFSPGDGDHAAGNSRAIRLVTH